MPKLPRARFTKLLIEELSSVDEGAQNEAGSVILKRKLVAGKTLRGKVLSTHEAPTVSVSKRVMLTTSAEGHTHLLDSGDEDSARAGSTDSQTIAGATDYSWHCHPWARASDGTIVIGEAAGHAHELLTPEDLAVIVAADDADLDSTDTVAKRKEPDMSEKSKNEERLEAEIATARAYGDLTDAQKSIYAGLSDVEKRAFLAKSPRERDVDVAKSLEADPVIVEVDGVPYRKSAGPAMIALAKKAKENAEAVAKRDAELELERLEKRATKELGNLPKTAKAKVAVLRAIDAIADEEVRKEAHEMLAAANAAMGEVTKNIGHGGKPAAGTARAAFDEKLAEFAKSKNKSVVEATEEFMTTPEGEQLWEAQSTERFAQRN
jgi:hypothetical protein